MLGHVHVVGLDGMWEFFHGKSGRPKVLLLPHPEYDASEPPPPWLKAVALAFNHTDPYKTAFFAYVPPAESERIAQLFGASQLPALLGCRASIMWGWTTHIYSPELTAQAMAARGPEPMAGRVRRVAHDAVYQRRARQERARRRRGAQDAQVPKAAAPDARGADGAHARRRPRYEHEGRAQPQGEEIG